MSSNLDQADKRRVRTAFASRGLATQLAAAALGTLLLTLSAKIQIPFWPVPMTLQTLAVCLIGVAFGARWAGITVAAYLIEGAVGLPVFAGTPERGLGLAYMMGPTGGFLAGFLVAAVAVGWLAERGWAGGWLKAAAAMTLGQAIMLAMGVLYLVPMFGWSRAVAAGVTPFLAATVVKIALGTALACGMLPGGAKPAR